MTKKALRQTLRQRLANSPREQLHAHSVAACELLARQPEYQQAKTVMIYLAMASELDSTPIALRGWAEGKRIVAPKVDWEERTMAPVEIRSLTTDVREGAMGVREPIGNAAIALAELDLVVTPGLGFDRVGNRLGRGRGYYDRFLAQPDLRAVSCGLAFEAQVVDQVPHEPTDAPMNMLVTEAQVLRFRTR